MRTRRRIERWLLGAACGLAVVGLGSWSMLRMDAGEPSAHLEDDWHVGHRVLDRNGTLLRELPSSEGLRGRPLPLEAVGPRLVAATLAAEDVGFYEHDGVDRVAILRAIAQNVRHGRVISGASTITQQLVKLLGHRTAEHGRDLGTKLYEAAAAQNLEAVLDKDEILVEYLNRLPYGHGLVGPEAAARGYFGVAAKDLSWAQATFLAVLPRAPSFLDPHQHPERVRPRQEALLVEMVEHGLLDAAQAERVLAEPIELVPLEHPFAAPHFVEMLRAERRQGPDDVTRTTLDAELQRDVTGIVRNRLEQLLGKGAHDAAVIVVDNATGDVLAWIGSPDFRDPVAGQVDMVRARRQPGSALKPFVYALAFARGRTGADVLADVPIEFAEQGGHVYSPDNFDEGFVGPISAREALAASLNVPAIELAAELGPGELLGALHQLGFASLDRPAEHYGLSLALGSGEVELRELAAAYTALARGGEAIPLRYRIDDPVGVGRRVFEPAVAATVTEALSDPTARVRLLHGRSPFDIGYPLALKTGTSSGFRDAWTVGYTAERTVAVWVGNADGRAMLGLTGATAAGPLFADVMRRAMRDVSTRAPLWDPSLLAEAEVCPLSGRPAGVDCPHRVVRRFDPRHVPNEPCAIHQRVRELTCDPHGPTVVAAWPDDYDRWLQGFPFGVPGRDPHGTAWVRRADLRGCQFDDPGQPELRLTAPSDGAVYFWTERGRDVVELLAAASGSHALGADDRLEFVVDGLVVGTATLAEPKLLVSLAPGEHEVYVRPRDPAVAIALRPTRFSVR